MILFRIFNFFHVYTSIIFFRFAHYLSLEDPTIVHGGER